MYNLLFDIADPRIPPKNGLPVGPIVAIVAVTCVAAVIVLFVLLKKKRGNT